MEEQTIQVESEGGNDLSPSMVDSPIGSPSSSVFEQASMGSHLSAIGEKVNKWSLIKKPVRPALTLTHEEIAERMTKLNETLLAEVEALPQQFNMKNTKLFDPMNRNGHYLPRSDPIIQNSFAIVGREERRVAAAHGPTISKERFSSKYWNTWNKDYVLLEDLSRNEIEAQQVLDQQNATLKTRPHIAAKKRFTQQQLSHAPGISFAPPKDSHTPYFDLHSMGNRNDVKQIFTKSLGHSLPKSLDHTNSLSATANVDPDSFDRIQIGMRTFKGGVINSGPARPAATKSLTSVCDAPPVDRPKGSPKMTGFYSSSRSGQPTPIAAAGGGEVSSEYKVPSNAITFSTGKRKGGDGNASAMPGVGSYDLPRIFETKNDPKPRDLSAALTSLQNNRDYRDISNEDLAKLVGFGYGCSRQEHVTYGMCLDGRCGRRSQIEESMLQTKQYARLGALSKADCERLLYPNKYCMEVSKRSKPATEDSKGLAPSKLKAIQDAKTRAATRRLASERAQWTSTLVPLSSEELTPLHMAAFRGDDDAIKKMIRLGSDINFLQGDNMDAPLHVAARRGHLATLNTILSVFEDKIRVSIQNGHGDTALHIAARLGRKEIVRSLCEADADAFVRNRDGKTAMEDSEKHSVKQILRIQQDYQQLQSELKRVVEKKEKFERKNRLARSSMLAGCVQNACFGEAGDGCASDGEIPPPSSANARPDSAASIPSSRGSERSRIMELDEDTHYDEARESIKINKSLFKISSSQTMLKDPKFNSYIVGYFPEEVVKKEKRTF